ncbi:hypothetical protein SSS_09613 [Sarcoptes scabiei]|uniref:Transmembrane protein 11 -like protein, mitochondrial n=1 Tax=Sarcoptes scabiei TaxID=52283 RepID=A0A834RFW4_SARSC|nr:hypothetical protein SSS_09613 [Sarcoptes scabiei]
MIEDRFGQNLIVIREIFDGAHELFENELEQAFEFGCPTIVIEPCRLGEETARWIFFGEYIAKYSFISGIGSVLAFWLWPDKVLIPFSILGSSLVAHCVYLISWQQDICSHYRVEANPEEFLKIMSSNQCFDDNVSSKTSNEYPGSLSEGEVENVDDSKHAALNKNQSNPLEMVINTSVRKQKSPVVLCRRSQQEMKRNNIINMTVSILAIAFSFIRYFRTSLSDQKSIKFENFQWLKALI